MDTERSRRLTKRLCEHCGKLLTLKAYKEHRRLFYHQGQWLTVTANRSRSRSSSPIDLSASSNQRSTESPTAPDNDDYSSDSSDEAEHEDLEFETDGKLIANK